MQSHLPTQRAQAIWREYAQRQDLEQKNRLEMAKQIMTWYSDLESEVSQNFKKALEAPRPAKRLRLDEPPCSHKTAFCRISTDSNGSWHSDSMSPSLSVSCRPLPSLFPPPPPPLPHGISPLGITFPEFYFYTSETDPVLTNHLNEDENHTQTIPHWDNLVHLIVSHAHLPEGHIHQSEGSKGKVDAWLTHSSSSEDGELNLEKTRQFSRSFPSSSELLHTSNYDQLEAPQSHSYDGDHTPFPSLMAFNSTCDGSSSSSSSSSSLSLPDPSSDSSSPNSPPLSLNITAVSSSKNVANGNTSDDVISSEDDIIDNIQLDWTEEEKRELKTIVV